MHRPPRFPQRRYQAAGYNRSNAISHTVEEMKEQKRGKPEPQHRRPGGWAPVPSPAPRAWPPSCSPATSNPRSRPQPHHRPYAPSRFPEHTHTHQPGHCVPLPPTLTIPRTSAPHTGEAGTKGQRWLQKMEKRLPQGNVSFLSMGYRNWTASPVSGAFTHHKVGVLGFPPLPPLQSWTHAPPPTP